MPPLNAPRIRGPPPPPPPAMDLTDSGRGGMHAHPPPPPMMMPPPPFRPPFHRGVPFFIREIYKVRLAEGAWVAWANLRYGITQPRHHL